MAAEPVIQRAFASGELAPALAVRADLAKYTTGLKRCRNFIVQRHGGVANRPGFRYVSATKDYNANVRLIRYKSEIANESILIEMGIQYFRFFKNGAPVELDPLSVDAWSGATAYLEGDIVVSGGINYYCITPHTNHIPPNSGFWYPMPDDLLEIPHPFTDPAGVYYVQSGRVITFCHIDVHPQELTYGSATYWVLDPVTTSSSTAAPGSMGGAAGGAGTLTYRYVVTAAGAGAYEESAPSAVVTFASCAAPTTAAPNVITWAAVSGAPEYYVYCDPYGNGTYGYVGTATGATQFNDCGFAPKFEITPPIGQTLFNTSGNYPSVVAYHQQRRFFAHTENGPDEVFGSRVGFPSNFGIASPLQDDDAISFRIAGNQHHPVRHLIALKTLLVMTDGGVWQMGVPQEPISPSNTPGDQESYIGVSGVVPCVVGNTVLYLQARDTQIRDLRFEQQSEGFGGRDLTIFAGHLFDGFTVREIDHALVPHSILWCVRSDGALNAMTYIPEQEVWGWHRHDSGEADRFEHVCVVPEGDEDAVYVIIKRIIDGNTVRYIERLARRDYQEEDFNAEAFFVDSGLSYSGVPDNFFGGLEHLSGMVVAVVGDGQVVFNGDPTSLDAPLYTVTAGGTITLTNSYSDVHIGLPIRYGEIELLNLDANGVDIRDRKKKIASIALVVDRSSRTFLAGPDTAHLAQYTPPVYDGDDDEYTGIVDLNLYAHFAADGRVFIRQPDPLPLTILGAIPRVEVGG